MNQNRAFRTTLLFLLLGATMPVFAQKGQEKKGGEKAQAKQSQHQKQSKGAQKTQHAQKAQRTQQPRRVQQAQRQPQSRVVASNRGNNGFHGNGNNGNHYGRIPDNSYRAHFGHDHSFRMIRPTMVEGYNRFEYSGYSFGFDQPWPSDWNYNDDVYVEYVDGGYYLYNPRHVGIRITLNLF
jgi:hypothetical protein